MKYLKYGEANYDNGDGQDVGFEPFFAFFETSLLVYFVNDHVLADFGFVANAVAALAILNVVRIAATVRHTARLDPRILHFAFEILIFVPVVGY